MIKRDCGPYSKSAKTGGMISAQVFNMAGRFGLRFLTLSSLLVLVACAGGQRRAAPCLSGTSTDLSCVPYARDVSGIDLHGDAYRWWREAAGVYPRSHVPQIGAVLVLKPHGSMSVGHVAVVTAVRSNREILVTQANWLPGRIEQNVPVVDVSRLNNWSYVRVWYAPIQALGNTIYPAYGFILPN